MNQDRDQQWLSYSQRYMAGEWRAPIFRDMILADAAMLAGESGHLSILDIGCGGGFDSDARLQESISAVADEYIGVEPDVAVDLGPIFSAYHRCCFEDAPLADESIDIAFAVMVLEHFENPRAFWDKVHRVLRKGGVFWGFTVDARHWFVTASAVTGKLGVKDFYLDLLHGRRGVERYENYDVFYRTNTPRQIQAFTRAFTSTTVLNFLRVGQMDFYLPPGFRWLGRWADRAAIGGGRPGNLLAVRVRK